MSGDSVLEEDKIKETMSEKIAQLERELRYTKELLYSEKYERKKYESALDSMRAGASQLVAQWERNAAVEKQKCDELSKQLELSKVDLQNCQGEYSMLNNKYQETEIKFLKQQEDFISLKNECDELRESNKKFANLVGTLEKEKEERSVELGDVMQQLKNDLLHEKKQQSKYISELKSQAEELDKLQDENETLRDHLNNVSLDAEKMLRRTIELTEKYKFLEKENKQLEALISSKTSEVELFKTQVEYVQKEKEKLSEDNQQVLKQTKTDEQILSSKVLMLEEENFALKQKLSETLEITRNQSDAFSQLEGNTKKLQIEKNRDEEVISQLKNQLDSVSEELRQKSIENKKITDELCVLRERVKSALAECEQKDQRSLEMEKKLRECDTSLEELKHVISNVEERYSTLAFSAQSLHTAGALNEQKILSLLEANFRSTIIQSYLECMNNDVVKTLLELQKRMCEEEKVILLMQSKLHEAKNEVKSFQEHYTNKENMCDEQQKTISAMELNFLKVKKDSERKQVLMAQLEDDNIFLKKQVESLTKELDEVDTIVITQMSELQDINEKLKKENKKQVAITEDLSQKYATESQQHALLRSQYERCQNEYIAQSKALGLTESELIEAKNKEHLLTKKLNATLTRLGEEEAKVSDLTVSRSKLECTVDSLRHQLSQTSEKYNLLLKSKREEIALLREKLTKNMELMEKQETSMSDTHRTIENYEKTIMTLKTVNNKLKNNATESATELERIQSERNRLLNERDVATKRYKELQECLSSKQKKATEEVSAELKKIVSLCTTQEDELEKLRRENLLLKNSLTMFVTTTQPKTETIFTERLNLTEGPLRHPKKRMESKS